VGDREKEDASIAGGGVVGLWCADASQCGIAVGDAVIGIMSIVERRFVCIRG
jgi:hypothetical protein